ncbi:MAG: hypothetical protein Q9173_002123 [Seirophora scorigena]
MSSIRQVGQILEITTPQATLSTLAGPTFYSPVMSLWGTLTGRRGTSSSSAPSPSSSDTNSRDSAPTTTFQSTPFDPTSAQDASSFLGGASLPDPSQLHPLAGLNQQTLDYLSLDESALSDLPGGRSALPSRGWSDDLQYGTGTTYLSALTLGGVYGMAEGFRRTPASAPPKIRLNSVLNSVTRRGPFLGNSAGIIAMVYNGINSTIGHYRGKHDSANSIVAGALSGMLFKSTRGVRPMMISGGLVAGAAGAWAISFKRSIEMRMSITLPCESPTPSPVERNIMDNLQSDAHAQEIPSINDIIDWHVEQSINSGRLGYSTNFPTSDLFNVDPKLFKDAATFDSDDVSDLLETALNDYAAEQDRAIDHMGHMDAHPELLVEAEGEIDRRLAQAGKTQQDIDGYASGERVLRRKIDDLYNLENPSPRKRNVVAAYIYYGTSENRHSADINLHISGSLAEFKSSARTYLNCIRDMWQPLEAIYDEDGLWKYKWKPKDKVVKIKEEWFPLESEHDYKILIQQATNPSREPFSVVLMQEVKPNATKPKNGTHGSNDIQEEDQNPDDMPPPMPSDMHFFFDDDFDLLRDLEACDVEGSINGKYEAEFGALVDAYKAMKEREASRALNDQKRVDHDTARRAQPKTPADRTRAGREGGQPNQRNSNVRNSITPFFPSKKSSKE